MGRKRQQLEVQIIDDDDEEETVSEVFHSTLPGHLPYSKKSKRTVRTGNSRQEGMLDSNLFSHCFENIWNSFSDNGRASFTYLDCLWFSWYMNELYKEKVLVWIKRKHIFSKKYVLIPIVHWNHWNLLILCNFGERLQSETRTTCMLLLDSLQMAGPRRLEPMIRKFVLDIYEVERRPEKKEAISKIPLLVPKVPQQRDDKACGSLVLYFISLFMENAPENFSITRGYPYFMKDNWFGPEDFDRFCKKFQLSSF